jgi:hypothetical protein
VGGTRNVHGILVENFFKNGHSEDQERGGMITLNGPYGDMLQGWKLQETGTGSISSDGFEPSCSSTEDYFVKRIYITTKNILFKYNNTLLSIFCYVLT